MHIPGREARLPALVNVRACVPVNDCVLPAIGDADEVDWVTGLTAPA